MNADADAQLFGHRHHLLDEVGVVLPQLFLGELAAVGQRRFEDLAGPVALGRFQPEGARRRAAAGRFALGTPDAVAHVGVGRVEDPGLGQIAQVLLVLLDLLVAARQVQRDLRHVVDVRVADVRDFQAGRLPRVAWTGEGLVGAARGRDADVLDAELPGET